MDESIYDEVERLRDALRHIKAEPHGHPEGGSETECLICILVNSALFRDTHWYCPVCDRAES